MTGLRYTPIRSFIAERQGFEPWRRLPVDRLAICSVTTPAPLLKSIRFCDPTGARTQDPNIKSVVLYQLSYRVKIFVSNRVTVIRFELTRLATPPPQDGESTNSSTRPLLLSVLVKDLKKSHHAGYEFCSKK